MRDYYEILKVQRSVDATELKAAYRRIAMRYHPDKNPDDPNAEETFKEATAAYSVLSDPSRRQRYDRVGHDQYRSSNGGFGQPDFSSISEMLEGWVGEMFGSTRTTDPRRARDLTYELRVSFVEAALGARRSITVERPVPCDTCEGSGAKTKNDICPCERCAGKGTVKTRGGVFSTSRTCSQCEGTGARILKACTDCAGSGKVNRPEVFAVKIPPGVSEGAVRSVRHGGEIKKDSKGDLHITICVDNHELFTREGADVLCTLPITYPEAVLGTQLQVPTLDGKVTIKIPAGTKSGQIFRLKGKGISVYAGYGKGDQMVTVEIDVPETLTTRQHKLISDLAAEFSATDSAHVSSIFARIRRWI